MPSQTENAAPYRVHWTVRMNHRNRTFSFVLLCVVLGLHMSRMGVAAWGWVLLGLQFLVYPQVAYLTARGAKDQLAAETRNMRVDAVCFGAWMAALHFPVWIAFILFTGVSQNLMAFKGPKGFVQSVALVVAGVLPVAWFTGWAFHPATSGLVTALSISVITLYLGVVALDGHRRSMRLHEARLQVRSSEQALQRQLTEIQALHGLLKEQANRDGLTGLYNRRYLDATIERELARCDREGQQGALLMIDIDRFKQINDVHGHQVGDDVLRHTADILNERVRSSDIVCRYGGEEFLLWLPNTQAAAALDVADELLRGFAASPWLGQGKQAVHATLSIGVAVFPEHASQADSLIAAADRALYQAKHEGRNRVCVARSRVQA